MGPYFNNKEVKMKKTIMITMIPVAGWAYVKALSFVAIVLCGGAV